MTVRWDAGTLWNVIDRPIAVLCLAALACSEASTSTGSTAADATPSDMAEGVGETLAPPDTSTADSESVTDAAEPDGGDAEPVADVPEAPPGPCELLGLAVRPFDTGPGGTRRHELAADFSAETVLGGTFRLSEAWTGCESFVFVPDSIPVDDQHLSTSIWETDLAGLVAGSPKNAHYVFFSRLSPEGAAQTTPDMQGRVQTVLADLSEADRAWWRERLHVLKTPASEIGGWFAEVSAGIGQIGFAIDREQRLRGLGSLANVKKQVAGAPEGSWPWSSDIAYAAHEARYFNAEAERAAAMAAQPAPTVVTLWDGVLGEGFMETDAELPADVGEADTLEIEIRQRCPDPDAPEPGNCGAWDYLAYLFVDVPGQDPLVPERVELARFITTYHREAHWVIDVSPMLAFLRKGGTRHFRWEWAPEWNKQPTATWVSLRFSNRGKGLRPMEAIPLWAGGDLGTGYNAAHPPISAAIPEDAARVDFYAVITGHGAGTTQCAEFCNHQHRVTLGGETWAREHPIAQTQTGCIEQIEHGMTPNQWGTWWFGRGGWCPGQQVEPWTFDVTAKAPKGSSVEVSYEARVAGAPPADGSGNIVMSSWLVIWK